MFASVKCIWKREVMNWKLYDLCQSPVENIVENSKEDRHSETECDDDYRIVDHLFFGWPGDFFHFSH